MSADRAEQVALWERRAEAAFRRAGVAEKDRRWADAQRERAYAEDAVREARRLREAGAPGPVWG